MGIPFDSYFRLDALGAQHVADAAGVVGLAGRGEMSGRSQLCRDGSQASPLPGLGGLEPVCDPHTGL